MPGEVEADKEEEKAEESTAIPEAPAPAPPRPVVGIIYPPPEVRSILSPLAWRSYACTKQRRELQRVVRGSDVQ